MFVDIIKEFQNVTRFNIFQYFQDYVSFLKNEFPSINRYYAGQIETIDYAILNKLDVMIKQSNDLMRLFSSFSNKLSNAGYWELQEYCQQLLDTLEKIKKLPKYNRVSKTKFGYKPYIQVNSSVGSFKTPEDLTLEINSQNVNHVDIIFDNELNEADWEIDKLHTGIMAYVDNQNTVFVPTILEEPVNDRVYGRDIKAKIEFENEDLSIVKYTENIEQKCDILLSITRGSVPEFPAFGRKNVGNNANMYGYVELIKDLTEIFLQDPIFANIQIKDITFKEGDIFVNCYISTKYFYSTNKTLTI